MNPLVLSVRDLCVDFPTRKGVLKALHRVSFDVEKGEVLGIVGESGAGKSLTGAAVIGLLAAPGRISGGEIWLNGQRIDNVAESEMRLLRGRHIGMIFQDPLTSLNPVFTVGRQLVETLLTHHRMTPRQARLEAIQLLSEVGITAPERRIDSYPHEMSGGMRQRVVIALALAPKPELIIADEPTTALDVSIQAQIMALLKRIASDRGMAIMLISHDMGVIAQMADRVVVMYAGQVAEIGPVAEVLSRPRHPYSRGLMASIPGLRDERPRLQQIPGYMPRLSAKPSGCSFHPRCPCAFHPCSLVEPELKNADTVKVACHLYG